MQRAVRGGGAGGSRAAATGRDIVATVATRGHRGGASGLPQRGGRGRPAPQAPDPHPGAARPRAGLAAPCRLPARTAHMISSAAEPAWHCMAACWSASPRHKSWPRRLPHPARPSSTNALPRRRCAGSWPEATREICLPRERDSAGRGGRPACRSVRAQRHVHSRSPPCASATPRPPARTQPACRPDTR